MLRPFVLVLALLASCGGEAKPPAASPAPAATPSAAAPSADGVSQAVVRIGDKVITFGEIDGLLGEAGMMQARMELHTARTQALDQLINKQLVDAEAATRGVSVEDLQKQVVENLPPPSEEELRAFYDKNAAQMGGASFEQISPRIGMHLSQMKAGEASAAFLAELRDKAGVEVLLQPPRVEVEAGDSPRVGSVDAPVQIIEFSDFQCPYCTTAADTMRQVKDKYGDKVSVVYRHFPLPMHAEAPRAAEAAECANDQDKFWPYHDLLFANQRAMSDDDLKRYAAEAELDAAAFASCLEAGTHKAKVAKDMADGQAAGMSGTPGFYINGMVVSGALPLEHFSEMIDAELARLGKG